MLTAASFRARALLVGARLDLRHWPEGETLARAPLAATLPGGGIAVLFRFGVAVLFDAAPGSEAALRERLAALTDHPYPGPELERTGRIRGGTREHLKRIGALLLMEGRMVGRAAIGDKPELLWEHPGLEGLNAVLEDEFEIHERLDALDRKLELVARTERTLVDLISTRHSLRVEWYIVALIAFEILLGLYELWARM